MTSVDRCTCYQELIKHVGDGFARFQITEKDDACHVHGDIDEILHGGEYTDRRGRRWTRSSYNAWTSPRPPRVSALIDEWQMRLLIERDQHRGECVGLWACDTHPVPYVLKDRYYTHGWWAMPAGEGMDRRKRYTLAEAMDDARALAVGA